MSTFDQIATRIIKEQELIIGPIAWSEASKVQGIHVLNQKTGELTMEGGDSKLILDNLVKKYESLFGRASIEVCKEAAASLIADLSPAEVPASLQ